MADPCKDVTSCWCYFGIWISPSHQYKIAMFVFLRFSSFFRASQDAKPRVFQSPFFQFIFRFSFFESFLPSSLLHSCVSRLRSIYSSVRVGNQLFAGQGASDALFFGRSRQVNFRCTSHCAAFSGLRFSPFSCSRRLQGACQEPQVHVILQCLARN